MATPANEAEFEELMASIDAEMAKEQVPIPGRALGAARLLAMRTGLDVLYPLPKRLPAPEVYDGIDLAIRTRQWFNERYGEKLKIDFSLGRVAVNVRGDAWFLKIPFLAGSFYLTADPGRRLPKRTISLASSEPDTINILECVEKLPDALARDLSEEEKAVLVTVFRTAAEAFSQVADRFRHQYVAEVRTDLASAADHLVSQYGHTGQSKWSSLQAVEKMFKAYIRHKNGTIKQTHNLTQLAADAGALGLPPVPPALIAAVQTQASARYGDLAVSLEDAVAANHAAIEICGMIAASMPKEP